MNTPSNSFSFQGADKDEIDRRLREFVNGEQEIVSVRPERQAAAQQRTVRPQLNSVPVVQAPATPMQEPEGISIDLPSRFHYYDFKDLYVKPFRVFHLAKLAKANETGSLQTLAEAVSSVLSSSTTTEKNLAFRLTMADFNAVLYWLRLNSFGKKQMKVKSMCLNPDHLHKVSSGELSESTLEVSTIYTESDIKTNYLDEAPDPAHFFVTYQGNRVELKPETMMDVVQFMDHPKWQDEEFQYLARIGAVLALPGTVGDRAEIAAKLEPDEALTAMSFAERLDAYGIEETVTTKCAECGASGTVKIVVDAPAFLSPEF